MASILTKPFIFFWLLSTSLFVTIINGEKSSQFSTEVPMKLKQKVSHLHFYFHDILSGRNPTAIPVAGPSNLTKTDNGFGAVMMADDPLTEGPEPNSKLVGRAQGIYASAGQHELGLLMVMNFAFVEGKYNGSALSILGKNSALHPVRELPIVGGSGLFRFARGFALAKTHWFDLKTGDAIVEYNVSVMHY